MTTTVAQLINEIETLDNAAAHPALRSVAHGALSRGISSYKWHIRMERKKARDEARENSIDDRNEKDQPEASGGEWQRSEEDSPLYRGNACARVYHTLVEKLTQSGNKWVIPMEVGRMLVFQLRNTNGAPESTIQALSKASGISEEDIRRTQEIAARNEAAELRDMIPEIEALFSYVEAGDLDAGPQMDPIGVHGLTLKAIQGLEKEKDRVMMNALRRRTTADLGSLPLIEEGVDKLKAFAAKIEEDDRELFEQALERGAALTLVSEL